MAETHIQIGDISPRIQYTGDGSQTAFTYPFPIFTDADMEVYEDDTLKTIVTDYTVSGAGNSSGGTVTFVTAPANAVTVTLKRNLAIARTSDFQESGEFRSKVINDELDTLTAALQQVDDGVSRSLRLSATDSSGNLELPDKATRSSMFLGFDASGDPIATDASGPQGPAGNMDGSNNLSELTNVGTARTTLGLGSAAVEDVAAGGSGDLLRADGDGSGLTGISGVTDAVKANIILNAFRIAINGGLSVQNMVDGVADEYEDETGVDLPTSTNEQYDATGDFYSSDLDLIASASTNWAGGSGFTHSGDDIAHAGASTAIRTKGSTPIVLSGDFTVEIELVSEPNSWGLGVYPTTDDASFAQDTTGGMSLMSESWYATGEAIYYAGTSKQAYTGWANPSTYKIQRVAGVISVYDDDVLKHTFTETSTVDMYFAYGSNAADDFDDFSFLTEGQPHTMMIQSNATTALAVPTEAFIAVWEEDVDAVTLNTDLKAYASRDGGTTWTQITLAEEAVLSTGRILTGTADISGQPSGTSMKYKLDIPTVTGMKLHGAALQWS